jgi:deoxyadenosine/deoxycytidine kinase
MIKIISIEGNIGSGKSTLLNKIRESFKNIIILQEPVDVWDSVKDESGVNILTNFYSDMKKYAFQFQMMAFITRLRLLKESINNITNNNNSNNNVIILTERSVFTDREVFAKMLYSNGIIDKISWEIYNDYFSYMTNGMIINEYYYLDVTPEECLGRILFRNRPGEVIELEYLKECEMYHKQWLKNENNVFYFTDPSDVIINIRKNT